MLFKVHLFPEDAALKAYAIHGCYRSEDRSLVLHLVVGDTGDTDDTVRCNMMPNLPSVLVTVQWKA